MTVNGPDFERAKYGDGYMYAIFLPGSADEEGARPEILADPRPLHEILEAVAVDGWLHFRGVVVEGQRANGRKFPMRVMGGSLQTCEGMLVRYHDGVEGPEEEDGEEDSRPNAPQRSEQPAAPPHPFKLQ